MKLYGYWRSSASWRVRIALAYKNIPYEPVAVNLARDEQHEEAYAEINAAHEVPTLEVDGMRLGQSLAILHYLEERCPQPPLFPLGQPQRALALQIAEAVNASIHPLQNLRVLKKLEADCGFDEAKKAAWARHFITLGFQGIEPILDLYASVFAIGESFSIADCFLLPQIYNARRFNVDMSVFPTLSRLESTLLRHPAIVSTHPSAQPDAPKS